MAESSTSSLTSTSHTLTIAAPYGSMTSGSMPSLGDIASALAFRDNISQIHREPFLKPASTSLPTGGVQYAQVGLSTFAGQLSDEQQDRMRLMHSANAERKKRKRLNGAATTGATDDELFVRPMGPVGPLLKIRRVHVDGFEVPQIWQQANRILAASTKQSKFDVDRFDAEDAEDETEEDDETELTNGVNGGINGERHSLASSADEDEEEEEGDEEEEEDEENSEDELSMGEEGEDDFDDMDNAEEEEEEEEDKDDLDNQPLNEFVEDADGLNDGFFDLNQFNKQSLWFEAQDARADPNTDANSEDEELDWHTDPFTAPSARSTGKKGSKKQKSSRRQGSVDEDEMGHGLEEEAEDNEDDGPPIFGDMDLDAPSGESDNEDLAEGGLADGLDMDMTANDIFYKDFFAPPAKKRGDRDRPGRSRRPNGPSSTDDRKEPFQPDDEDVQRAIRDVRRDLFEQLSDESGDDGADDGELSDGIDGMSDVSAGDVRSRRSAHERRQAKILAEIRRLEADALKEKNWTLAGEASASARPINSLLEEDLDFEHIGKPVPVITQEVTENIEALVKRRILEQTFDEVRRRYGTSGDDERTRRGLRGLDVEIDDQQAKKGLAAVYEEEHQQAANPETYVSQSDEKLRAEEREVEQLWLEVSAKLDALSNWHYKPRPAAPQMTVVADVATVAMEDAQPATAQGVSGGASMLAPQEVYKPGAAADKKGRDKDIVVVTKSGLPVARDEMTREEKLRRRRRNKERIRKSGSGLANGTGVTGTPTANGDGDNAGSGKVSSQQETLATLKKAGVKVIGRKGELQDLEGNKPRAAQALSSGNFKL